MIDGKTNGRPPGVAIFGPFRFDLSTRELSKNGLTLPLEEQPAQALSYLIERAGTMVSRDDLRKLLWPSGVHADYEHGVNKSINKLRTVLGDYPAAPRLIATLRGRGYRFIAPVGPGHPLGLVIVRWKSLPPCGCPLRHRTPPRL